MECLSSLGDLPRHQCISPFASPHAEPHDEFDFMRLRRSQRSAPSKVTVCHAATQLSLDRPRQLLRFVCRETAFKGRT